MNLNKKFEPMSREYVFKKFVEFYKHAKNIKDKDTVYGIKLLLHHINNNTFFDKKGTIDLFIDTVSMLAIKNQLKLVFASNFIDGQEEHVVVSDHNFKGNKTVYGKILDYMTDGIYTDLEEDIDNQFDIQFDGDKSDIKYAILGLVEYTNWTEYFKKMN